MRRLSSLTLLIGLSLAGAVDANAQHVIVRRSIPVPKLGALVVATPGRYAGHCPVEITFEGVVTAEGPDIGPLPVSYTWLRSDNAQGPVGHGSVQPRQPLKITETWTLGGASLPNYKGGEQLKVWYDRFGEGGAVLSDRAGFHIKCQ